LTECPTRKPWFGYGCSEENAADTVRALRGEDYHSRGKLATVPIVVANSLVSGDDGQMRQPRDLPRVL